MDQSFYEKTIHWLLLILTIIYLLTGLGITQYHIIESLTFGLLTKNLSFRIHENLLEPFVILLILHVLVKPIKRVYARWKGKSEATC